MGRSKRGRIEDSEEEDVPVKRTKVDEIDDAEIDDAEIEDKFGDIEIFREKLASDDEDFDDVYEYIMEEQDPVECYDWQYSQIKGGYETEWYSGEDCIEPRGNKTF